jgi:hypothetical protein
VDAICQIDKLVMDVPGLEIEAGGEAFAGIVAGTEDLGRERVAGIIVVVYEIAAAQF